MTFKNITKNAVINAAGRLVDPGVEIYMPVEYYAKHKAFVDTYVTEKKGKVGGLDEYKSFLQNGPESSTVKEEEKVDLMAEVIEEEAEKVDKAEATDNKKDDAKEKEEEKEATKKTSRRRRASTKTEE